MRVWIASLNLIFLKRFFETFCEHAPQNKLHGSTNFIIFGSTNKKLWVFENFRRSLGKAGMCWNQLARIDHMCKKMLVKGRRIFCKGGVMGTKAVEEGNHWSLDSPLPVVGSCNWVTSHQQLVANHRLDNQGRPATSGPPPLLGPKSNRL
jgi:hypothetical protein